MFTARSAARWRAVALISAIFGAGVSAYLLVEYSTGQGGLCLTGSGCDLVRDSAYAYPLGIPLPLFGLAYYLLAAALAYRTLTDSPLGAIPVRRGLFWLTVAGGAFTLFLTGVEAFVVGAFCTWCLAQAIASWILLLSAAGLAASPLAPVAEGSSRRARRMEAEQRAVESGGARRAVLGGGSVTALLVAGLLLVGAGSAPGPAASTAPDAALAPASAPHLGSGAVTLVEFADFQCPACAVAAPLLHQLAAGNEITLVARYFPLTQIHPNAMASARAAAAANLQGQYWPMSERLFAEQAAWESLPSSSADAYFAGLAGDLGLDVERWMADYTSSASSSPVNDDLDAATQLRLPGTPSIFINGSRYTGSLTLDALRSAIAAAG